jgi:hypothetical protein
MLNATFAGCSETSTEQRIIQQSLLNSDSIKRLLHGNGLHTHYRISILYVIIPHALYVRTSSS